MPRSEERFGEEMGGAWVALQVRGQGRPLWGMKGPSDVGGAAGRPLGGEGRPRPWGLGWGGRGQRGGSI